MIGGLGSQELLIVVLMLVLFLGASRVADLGGALGRGIREFRTEAKSDDSDAGSVSEESEVKSSDSKEDES